eukprot:5285819-Pleurochrysis_carterae.AAC.2
MAAHLPKPCLSTPLASRRSCVPASHQVAGAPPATARGSDAPAAMLRMHLITSRRESRLRAARESASSLDFSSSCHSCFISLAAFWSTAMGLAPSVTPSAASVAHSSGFVGMPYAKSASCSSRRWASRSVSRSPPAATTCLPRPPPCPPSRPSPLPPSPSARELLFGDPPWLAERECARLRPLSTLSPFSCFSRLSPRAPASCSLAPVRPTLPLAPLLPSPSPCLSASLALLALCAMPPGSARNSDRSRLSNGLGPGSADAAVTSPSSSNVSGASGGARLHSTASFRIASIAPQPCLCAPISKRAS